MTEQDLSAGEDVELVDPLPGELSAPPAPGNGLGGSEAVLPEDLLAMLIHPRRILPQLPCVTANDEVAAQIRSGRAVNLPELSGAKQVKVFAGQRELIAIATRVAGTLFHPKVVLALASPVQMKNGNRR